MRGPTRIVLADDHTVMRAGLRSLLSAEPDLEVVGEAGDGAECLEMVAALAPDVVVLDVSMPRLGGLEALEVITAEVGPTRVLVLTMHDDPAYLRRALHAGCAGFILKESASDELLAAIRWVAGGGLYVHPRHARVLLEEAAAENARRGDTGDRRSRLATLSARESEIFRLTAFGHSNAEIADLLSLSVKTVETYRERMMKKLGLEGRAALVRLALEAGILR